MANKVVATESEAKVGGNQSDVAAAGGGKGAATVTSTGPAIKDQVQTPDTEVQVQPSEQPKVELPSAITPTQPVPTPGQAGAAPTAEQGREGFFDQANITSADQFLQIIQGLRDQYQGKLSDTIENRAAEDDERTAALSRQSTEQRTNMRDAEQKRGEEYAEFIEDENEKANERMSQWEEHTGKMNTAREALDKFYNDERTAAEKRASDWGNFSTEQTAAAAKRGADWQNFLGTQENLAQQRGITWDQFLAQQGTTAAQRKADWDTFYTAEQTNAANRKAQMDAALGNISAVGAQREQAYNQWVAAEQEKAAQRQAQWDAAIGNLQSGGRPKSAGQINGKIPSKIVTNPMTGQKKKVKDPYAKALAKGKKKANGKYI